MSRIKNWFLGLSKIGKASIIGVLLFGAMTASGAQQSTTVPSVESNGASGSSLDVKVEEPSITYNTIVEKKAVPFEKQTTEDATMAKGTSVVRIPGQDGVVTITHKLTLQDGKEIARETSEETTKSSVAEVTAIGTYVQPEPKCDSNYSGCVPIVSYDLDCPDIGFSVYVYGYDKHGFDGDNDGEGCESY